MWSLTSAQAGQQWYLNSSSVMLVSEDSLASEHSQTHTLAKPRVIFPEVEK